MALEVAMPNYSIHFTVDEARAALPDLRAHFARIRELIAEIRTQVGHANQIVRSNGHGPVIQATGPQRDEIQALIGMICDQGVVIKDLELGLVDFPHLLGGNADHEVFLCWRCDEDTIAYWHEIDDGFAGRRPL
jgi:hypothetical protein